MKRTFLIIFLLALLVSVSEAQLWKMKRYEIAGGFGPSFFFGDIGGFSKTENILGLKDLSFVQTRFGLNLDLKYRLTQDINARVSFVSGLLHASDARGSNETRGYESSISIFETTFLGEYYLIKNVSENSYLFASGSRRATRGLLNVLDVYIFAGLGGLSYTTKPNDKLIARQLLDGFKPGNFSVVLPAGVGVSVAFISSLSFGAEISGRYALSDKLDGFTSSTSKSNDIYYFLNLKAIYKLKTARNGWPSFK